MPRLRPGFVLLLVTLIAGIDAGPEIRAQDAPAPAPTKTKPKAPRRYTGARTYMGRPIADVMTFHGADWLVRPEREQEEQPEAMLDALKIAPGATVADVGAGVGYTSLKLARRVGTSGTVYATDVQPEMLRMLAANAREAGVKNIKPVRCTATDPKLPEGQVDLILMVDVYHECADPEATLQGLQQGAQARRPARARRVPRRGPGRPDQTRAQDDPRPGPQGARAPGLHLQGIARVPPLAAHHLLREAHTGSGQEIGLGAWGTSSLFSSAAIPVPQIVDQPRRSRRAGGPRHGRARRSGGGRSRGSGRAGPGAGTGPWCAAACGGGRPHRRRPGGRSRPDGCGSGGSGRFRASRQAGWRPGRSVRRRDNG